METETGMWASNSVLRETEIQEDLNWEQIWEQGTNELYIKDLKGEGER